MKNLKVILAVLGVSIMFVSCKGSKCDCPSFSPKKHRGDILQKEINTINSETYRA